MNLPGMAGTAGLQRVKSELSEKDQPSERERNEKLAAAAKSRMVYVLQSCLEATSHE